MGYELINIVLLHVQKGHNNALSSCLLFATSPNAVCDCSFYETRDIWNTGSSNIVIFTFPLPLLVMFMCFQMLIAEDNNDFKRYNSVPF